MKKIILLSLTALALAACADTRSSVTSDATTWDKLDYSVKKDTQEIEARQEPIDRPAIVPVKTEPASAPAPIYVQ